MTQSDLAPPASQAGHFFGPPRKVLVDPGGGERFEILWGI